jgi:hypothetical protein
MDASGTKGAQDSSGWLIGRMLIWWSAPSESASGSRSLIDMAILVLEYLLRRSLNIYEFTTDSECILRLAFDTAEDEITLVDGTAVHPGDPIVGLHFWNEHLPVIPRDGPRLRWGLVMHDRLVRSLVLLSDHLERDGRYRAVKALRAEATFGTRLGRRPMLRVARRYGFELIEGEVSSARRIRYFWENVLVWALIRAFNPGGLRGKRFIRERFELWISRGELMRRYGAAARLSQG